MHPTVKFEHRPVRYGVDRVRIGSSIPGVGTDILDPDGRVWALLDILDGTRTVGEIVVDLVHRFPTWPARSVLADIKDLWRAGYLEDVGRPPPDWLSARERERYGRGRSLFAWMDRTPRLDRWEAQRRLRQARVVVIGLGGAGGIAAWALVASGVGEVHCVDPDVVELSNLNRQVLYTEVDIGRLKVDVAVDRLRTYNSDVMVTGTSVTIDGPEVLAALLIRCDVLVLCADQPQVIRSWTNQVCHQQGIAWVHAGYHGPLVSFGLYQPGAGACYDCARTAQRQHSAAEPSATLWRPATLVSAVPQAANAVTAGLAGLYAAHAAMSLITGVPALHVNREYGLNLVTLDEPIVRGSDVRHPDCPTCRRVPGRQSRTGHRGRFCRALSRALLASTAGSPNAVRKSTSSCR